ncbi:5'-3' exoribonuclease 3 [Tasmannia lanceolata]|uniref:5'-3' exoribonuclease 3 n=1 Tax=Tasmannia lanceolata TaxID=3420 RepID=UPI004063C94B
MVNVGVDFTIVAMHQAERRKRDRAQSRKGDDAEPQLKPELLAPVARYHGSRLASGPSPSPFQSSISVGKGHQKGQNATAPSVNIKTEQSATSDGKGIPRRTQKIACVATGGATLGAAIVEAENSLEIEIQENEGGLKAKLKDLLREKSDLFNSDNAEEDKVKLGETGWKERYYEEKFSAKTHDDVETIRKDVVLRYTEGLCWVMHYYYEGVCSWQWFYPYHYAPFASDLKDLDQLNICFEPGSPFKPFNQLLGVFPAASSHALPVHYRHLMTDQDSPIIDFYPTDFEVDMNGKRYAWQGIAKLPFIDECRLLVEVEKVEHTSTEEEVRRNSVMFEMLFVTVSHPLLSYIFSLDDCCKQLSDKKDAEIKEKIIPIASGGMNGYLSLCHGDPCPPIFQSPVKGMEDIISNQVICAVDKLPDWHKHITRPPVGVIFPKKTVTLGDLKPAPVLWHEDTGRKPWENGRQNPTRTISGRQLKEAAHRLVVNSLQVRTERNRGGQMHARSSYDGVSPHYSNGRNPSQEDRYSVREERYAYPTVQNHSNHGYGQLHNSPSTHHPYDRWAHPQYEPNYWQRDRRGRSHYPSSHQTGCYPYQLHNRPPAQTALTGAYIQPSGYNNRHWAYELYGAGQWPQQYNEYGNHVMVAVNHIGLDRGYPQQLPNPYSVLDRGANRRLPPPPPGYGRY